MRAAYHPKHARVLATERQLAGLQPSEAAVGIDGRLRGLVRATTLLDRTLGRGLERLVRHDGLARLGYASLSDYADQRLGLKGRHAQELAWIERSLPSYPVTAALYDEGRLSHAQVRALLRAYSRPGIWPLPGLEDVVTGRPSVEPGTTVQQEQLSQGTTFAPITFEEAWAHTACSLTVRQLEDALYDWRASSGESGAREGHEGVTLGGSGSLDGNEKSSVPGGGSGGKETTTRVGALLSAGANLAAQGRGLAEAEGLDGTTVAAPPEGTPHASGSPSQSPDTGGYPLHPPELADTPDLCHDERPPGRQVRFSATPLQAAKWYVALELASRQAGRDLAPAAMLEGAFAEFLVGEGYEALHRAGWEPGYKVEEGRVVASAAPKSPQTVESGEGSEPVSKSSSNLAANMASNPGSDPAFNPTSSLVSTTVSNPASNPTSDPAFNPWGDSTPPLPEQAEARASASSTPKPDEGPESKRFDFASSGFDPEVDDRAFWRQVERDISELNDHWAHLCWDIPQVQLPAGLECADTDDPFEADRRLVATVRIKQRSQSSVVRLLGQMSRWGLFRELEFVRLEQYARERLGMSGSQARSLVALHHRLAPCPKIRKAFATGKIHLTQAQEIVRVAREHTEDAWLERAGYTTVRFLREDVEEALRLTHLVAAEEAGFPPHRCGLGDAPGTLGAACQTCAREGGPVGGGGVCQTCAPSRHECGQRSSSPQSSGESKPVNGACEHERGDSAAKRLADDLQLPGRRGSDFRRLLQGILEDLQATHTLHGTTDLANLRGDDPSSREVTLGASNSEQPATSLPPFASKVARHSKSLLLTLGFWLPAGLEAMYEEVTAAVSILHGTTASVGTVLDEVLDAYLAQWGLEAIEAIRTHPAIDRAGWRCAVPTCTSRSNLQAHHILYRSRGGGNSLSNLVPLCASHHHHGEHAGYIHVTGVAPHRLEWQLGLRSQHVQRQGSHDKPYSSPHQSAHLTVRGRRVVPSAPSPDALRAEQAA